MSSKNGTIGLANPLANPNKDYDILHKIVLIGDSGKKIFFPLYIKFHLNNHLNFF